MIRADWYEQARCKGTNDPRFTPDTERLEAKFSVVLNETYCRVCPVSVDCLGEALRHRDTGIFAGMTTEQRRRLSRPRDRAKCPLCKGTEKISVQEHDVCAACGASWRTERKNGEAVGHGHDERGLSAARG